MSPVSNQGRYWISEDQQRTFTRWSRDLKVAPVHRLPLLLAG